MEAQHSRIDSSSITYPASPSARGRFWSHKSSFLCQQQLWVGTVGRSLALLSWRTGITGCLVLTACWLRGLAGWKEDQGQPPPQCPLRQDGLPRVSQGRGWTAARQGTQFAEVSAEGKPSVPAGTHQSKRSLCRFTAPWGLTSEVLAPSKTTPLNNISRFQFANPTRFFMYLQNHL